MIPSGADLEFTREELSRAILDVLATWPERDRRIFTRVRYEGESAESAARQEGVDPSEARAILAACERELLERLRVFRTLAKAQGLARAHPRAPRSSPPSEHLSTRVHEYGHVCAERGGLGGPVWHLLCQRIVWPAGRRGCICEHGYSGTVWPASTAMRREAAQRASLVATGGIEPPTLACYLTN